MFTRHFGFGWRGDLTALRIDDRSTHVNSTGGSTTLESALYRLELEPVQLMGSIYF